MAKMPTKEDMRTRFWALKNAIDAHEALIQEKNDALSELTAQEAILAAEKRALEADIGLDGLSMFDAKQELAFYGRGLGNVGTDPALEVAAKEAPAET